MSAESLSPFVTRTGRPWTWEQVVQGLVDDPGVRSRLTTSILQSGHPAAFWETMPSARHRAGEPYQQVVLPAPALARVSADPSPFAAQIDVDEPIVRFRNLGGDAELVVPTASHADYPHLLAFLRSAPPTGIDALWRSVGQAVLDWWSATNADVWVSTSGLGVSWLHVRLDSVPKYVQHRPFRDGGVGGP